VNDKRVITHPRVRSFNNIIAKEGDYIIIYKATNILNGKIYIGQTTNTLEYRKSQHMRETKSIKKKNTYFHNAINKYGDDNFIFEEIDITNSIEELNQREQYWIKYYNSTNKNIGYNLDSGGLNCFKSDSTKQKIGETTLLKWNDLETANKMLEGLTKGTEKWKQICEDNRVEIICPICQKSILLPPWVAKDQIYCSLICAGKGSGLKGIQKAAEMNKESNDILKQEIAIFILDWVEHNKETILECPYNKITNHLQPLLYLINEKYHMFDIRSLFKCFNVKSRKEFLKYLKDYIVKENIC